MLTLEFDIYSGWLVTLKLLKSGNITNNFVSRWEYIKKPKNNSFKLGQIIRAKRARSLLSVLGSSGNIFVTLTITALNQMSWFSYDYSFFLDKAMFTYVFTHFQF